MELINRTFHANAHDVFAHAAENVVNNGYVIIAFSYKGVERHIDSFVEIHLAGSVQADCVAAEIDFVEKQTPPRNPERGF